MYTKLVPTEPKESKLIYTCEKRKHDEKDISNLLTVTLLFMICLNPRAGKTNQILLSNWLAELTRRAHLVRSGLPALTPQEKVLFLAI